VLYVISALQWVHYIKCYGQWVCLAAANATTGCRLYLSNENTEQIFASGVAKNMPVPSRSVGLYAGFAVSRLWGSATRPAKATEDGIGCSSSHVLLSCLRGPMRLRSLANRVLWWSPIAVWLRYLNGVSYGLKKGELCELSILECRIRRREPPVI